MSNRRLALSIIACAAIGFIASSVTALAQTDYPNKPVKIIVPFPPGGTSDVMGRMIAEELSKALKQPFVVENIGGAGGIIGTEKGARAAPDGYTLIQTGVGQSAVAHGLNRSLGYDSNRDFVHISQVHSGPNVLVVHPDTPFKTFSQLIDYGKTNLGKLSYGYTHAASGHMAMELLKQTVSTCNGTRLEKSCKGLFMVGIPYRGGGPMMIDILGGQIPMMFINQDVALAHIKSGKLRALAVTSYSRNPSLPDVPTIAESGYPGFSAMSWSGLSVPKGTPKAVAEKLEAAITVAMRSPAIRTRMEAQGFVIPDQGSAVYTAFVAKEMDRWTRVIRTADIKAQP